MKKRDKVTRIDVVVKDKQLGQDIVVKYYGPEDMSTKIESSGIPLKLNTKFMEK